jgi:cell pole-organizing protein PopZ
MAQVNSVQREPSMEEILASIRRIIEDSDGARKDGQGAAPGEVGAPGAANAQAETSPGIAGNRQADAGERPEEIQNRSRSEVESFRAELSGNVRPASDRAAPPASVVQAQPQRAAPQPDTPTRTVRLADIQAQLARESAAARPAEPEQKPLTLVDIEQEIATGIAEPTPAAPERTEVKTEPTLRAEPAAVRVASASAAAAGRTERPVVSVWEDEKPADAAAPEDGPADPGEVPSAASPALARQAIISPAAGRQVAAAFGELSEAFAARSKKTFDEIAEQMLRPMLQEWLDNNLPLLVERLVREEIERVARGS